MTKFHGLLLVDKPSGMTSHDVVAKVRRVLQTKAVGHTGTLDPLATGLMVLLVGEATKISDYLRDGDKGYEVEAILGLKTDSFDIDGEVLENKDLSLDPELVAAAVRDSEGDLELEVPIFSAIKKQGKKLYEYAREGKEVEIPKRSMSFYNLELIEATSKSFSARFRCSKGSYVRSWVQFVASRLSENATVKVLRRVWSAPYSVEKAVPLADLEALSGEPLAEIVAKFEQAFVPITQVLPHWKALTVGGRDERLMVNGQIPNSLGQRLLVEQKQANRSKSAVGIRVVSASTGQLLSIIEAQPFNGLKIRRIFNLRQDAHGS